MRNTEVNLYLLTYLCVCSGMSKSLELSVIEALCRRANVFECV